jgi:hypothetical protein
LDAGTPDRNLGKVPELDSYLTGVRRTSWGVPDAEFTELESLCSEAQALLQKAQNDAEQTHVITVECQEAFKALEAKMRFFRDRYFKIPPLRGGAWAAGLQT